MKTQSAVVTSKGQLVIPARLRRRYGIRRGTRVCFLEEDGRLVLQPVTREFIDSLQGSLKGKPSPLEFLLAERKRDRKL